MEFNACSLNQLETFGKLFPGGKCGVRFNPGTGSGGNGKTNVGGPSSSFGIWFELQDKVKEIVAKYNLKVRIQQSHIMRPIHPQMYDHDTFSHYYPIHTPSFIINVTGNSHSHTHWIRIRSRCMAKSNWYFPCTHGRLPWSHYIEFRWGLQSGSYELRSIHWFTKSRRTSQNRIWRFREAHGSQITVRDLLFLSPMLALC